MKLKRKTSIHLKSPVPVYDIQVSDNHNFCIGNGIVVHNSKDICDAICGSVYSCYENLDTAIQLSKKYRVETQNKFLQQRMQRSDDVFKDMLQGIYG